MHAKPENQQIVVRVAQSVLHRSLSDRQVADRLGRHIATALLDNWEAALAKYGTDAADALDVVERAAHAVVNAKRAR